jgi:predicted transcriptional regulator
LTGKYSVVYFSHAVKQQLGEKNMCQITNSEVTQLLKIYRKVDTVKVAGLSDDELAESLAIAHKLSKEIEQYEKAIKEAALARKLEKVLPEHDRKIVLVEKSFSSVDAEAVYKTLGDIKKFLPLVTVVSGRAEKGSPEAAAIEAATTVGETKTYCQVAKLTKADKQKLLG